MVDLNEVLREVNEIRRHEFGLDPISEIPKGRRESASSCPIARALQQDYRYGYITVVPGSNLAYDGYIRITPTVDNINTIGVWEDNSRKISIPSAIDAFLDVFDRYNGFSELVG